ncbi:MAG: integration host factor [Rickettsiales bacterium]|nr:MAG: integration host factor [Rickettsiales bacterium]
MQKPKPVTITKDKIAERLKGRLGLSSVICEEITSHIFSEILNITEQEGKLMLKNFGVWRINHKAARVGFNIKSGNSVRITPRSVLRFIPSKSFKEQINKSDAE